MSVGISRFLPNDYTGPKINTVPIRGFPREPTTSDKRFPVGQLVIIGKSPSSGTQGDMWYLSKFDGSGDAIWLQFASGIEVATTYVSDSGSAVAASNILNVLGGTNMNTSAATDTLTINLDSSITVTTVNAALINIDPGASGDSCIQFDINSTNEFKIGVDDTDDSFRISQGGALGTNDTLVITDAGERTLPLQPAFAAFLGTNDTNVTGDATNYVLGAGNALTEIFDRNSDFVTSGTFTAPVTGIYVLSSSLRLSGVTSGHTSGNATIVTSNRTWRTLTYSPFACFGAGGGVSFTNHVLADMDAADTATFETVVTGSTKTVTVSSGDATTWCSGSLYA